jgi:hypothetical protein
LAGGRKISRVSSPPSPFSTHLVPESTHPGSYRLLDDLERVGAGLEEMRVSICGPLRKTASRSSSSREGGGRRDVQLLLRSHCCQEGMLRHGCGARCRRRCSLGSIAEAFLVEAREFADAGRATTAETGGEREGDEESKQGREGNRRARGDARAASTPVAAARSAPRYAGERQTVSANGTESNTIKSPPSSC